MQRVPVQVQAGQLDPVLGEDGEAVVPRGARREDVVDGDVRRADEAADVDLRPGEPEIADVGQVFGQGAIVQDRGVDAELHRAAPLIGGGTGGALWWHR